MRPIVASNGDFKRSDIATELHILCHQIMDIHLTLCCWSSSFGITIQNLIFKTRQTFSPFVYGQGRQGWSPPGPSLLLAGTLLEPEIWPLLYWWPMTFYSDQWPFILVTNNLWQWPTLLEPEIWDFYTGDLMTFYSDQCPKNLDLLYWSLINFYSDQRPKIWDLLLWRKTKDLRPFIFVTIITFYSDQWPRPFTVTKDLL